MRKQLIIVLALILSTSLYSQSDGPLSLKQVNEDSKSGNYKDIFAAFYNLATTNLAGDNKSIEFNSTLFALKSKANPDLLIDYNYEKAGFSRNFQFNFKVDLDSTFSYSGFTGGFTIALINGRDKALADFRKTKLDTLFNVLTTYLDAIQENLTVAIVSNPAIADQDKEFQLLRDAVAEILDNEKENLSTSTNPYTAQILVQLNLMIAARPIKGPSGANITNRDDLVKDMFALIDQYYKVFDSKSLLTISADGSANDEGKFNKASVGMIFLKGNATASNELDLRAKLIYSDTLTTALPRLNFKATAGVNFKLFKGAAEKNFFEVKGALEYSSILKNVLADEKKDNFFANAEIRIRLTDDLWFPFIIKYDIENDNFLGFLNISYNFGGFK